LNIKLNDFMSLTWKVYLSAGKPKVHLTSDSPALNGSCITFTAKLEYPPCQKEDASGDLIWDEHSANGQVHSGYVYNWTSWLDDYGFGKCRDKTKCNVFPDGKPFPQRNDWRRKSYVYVWHTMGQYYETCDGSSSSVTINTTNIPLGAEVMEVMVYRKRERRKYSPLTTANTVFFVTDKIPVAVDISQKGAVNQSENIFISGEDVVFRVHLHDPSGYLKTAASIDYIWDFRDGNQLVTHRNMTTHAYSKLGTMSVKLVVEAAFPVECPPPSIPTTPLWLRTRRLNSNQCFRYAYGTFTGNITIIGRWQCVLSFLKVEPEDNQSCYIPTSACTIVSDPSCTQVRNIMCNDVPSLSECKVHLRRRFLEPGTYCVNITLENSSSLALTSTTITITKSQETPVITLFPHVYRPIRRSLVEDARARVGGQMVRLREALFPSSEESRHLLTERHPL
uniref:Glycoprotein nmb n=1 Tax=Amphilophus citrinellus TaxID=61819 RepID=A0A3Q0QWT1_AMPCI